jgi:hypothetical protein
MTFLSKCIVIVALIGLLNSVLFYALKENKEIRSSLFASFCSRMARTQSEEVRKIRCELLNDKDVVGKVGLVRFRFVSILKAKN